MFRALRRVRRNKGAPGVDGMTVEELSGYLRTHWLEIRTALLNGSYRRNRFSARRFQSREVGSASWEFQRCWIGLSSKR